MATIKFSDFTNQAVDVTDTRVVGFKVGDTSANYKYSMADLVTAIEPLLTPANLYTTDGTTGAGRVVTTTDTITFKKTGSPYAGIVLMSNYIAAYSKIMMDARNFVTSYAANDGWSFGVGNTSNSFHFNTNAVTQSDGYAMRIHANTVSPYGALILKGYGTSTDKNFTVQDSGANEVFSIQDDGLVKFSFDADSFATITVADSSNTTITTGETGTITFADSAGDLATIATLRTESFIVACSDETTVLATGANPVATFRMPYAFTLTAVRASLTTAGTTSGLTTIDINLGGSSIFTTDLLTIDFGDKTSVGATTPPNITTTALTSDGEITIDIDAISGGATETGLKVTLIGYQTV